jgi:nitrogen fixation protein
MARIKTYVSDVNVTGNDSWIGTDGDSFNRTKNFTPNKVANYLNSSEKIDRSNTITFTYQTLDPGESRSFGTISFDSVQPSYVAFSGITNILVSKRSNGLKYVDVFLSGTNETTIILQRGNSVNEYGLYNVTAIEDYMDDTNFFVFTLEFIQGNGGLNEDKEYLFSVVDFSKGVQIHNELEGLNDGDYIHLTEEEKEKFDELPNSFATKTSDLINDGEDGINPFITLEDIPNPPTPTLESVLAESNITNGNDISISDGDEITFDNGSRIRKGLTDSGNGGAKGVALVCSLDYELKWEAGRQYVMQQDGFTIREVSHNFTIVPTATDDDTKGFVIGSRWILDNGDVYECTDATEDNAVWVLTTIDLSGYVPYTGANQNVNLGEFEIKAGQFTLDTSPTGTATVGTTRWNNTLGSSETTLKGGSVILKNGVDLVARVVNKVTPNTTLTKANYAAVRVSGAQGQRLAVAYAQANNDLNSADTIGLVCETIPTNQEGFIITVGQLEGINTTGNLQGENWNDGDVIYLSPTVAGKLTNIKPTAPQHIVIIGYVEYAHANNGKLYVKIMNGWELEELHNVTSTNYTTPIDTDSVLTLDVTTSLWKRLSWSNIKSNLKTYFDTIYQTALGFTPENVANKATNLTSPDNTKYPTTQAVVNGLATKQNTLTNPVTGTGANGQVAFWNGTNSQTGDNGLFWDNTNKRLGVGTTTPENILSISATLPVNVQENVFLIKNLGITRTVITNLGIQSWSLNNGSSEVGRITYSTPSGRPGIIFFNSTSTGRSDIRQITGGGISIATTTLGTIPSDQFYFHPTGNFSINAATDAGFRLDVNGTTRLNGNTSIGGSTAGARLDVRAQGALSTDIAFRVRNSADTANLIQVNGLGGVEINSTTQGFLPPRMTTTQKNAIVSPASGLVIYDTTLNKLCVRGASAWETITSI